MKLAVIGGGSSYTPELIEGLIKNRDALPVTELALVDVANDEAQFKVGVIADLTRRMLRRAGLDVAVSATTERRAAIEGAAYVVTQFRVGGLAARARDERLPLKYGVIGQETTGPGGFAKALRTIPVILEVCRDIRELAPDAWLVNFTNPSGIITEAVVKHGGGVKVAGLCNVPIGMLRGAAQFAGVEPERVRMDFCGLNHLTWARRIYLDGNDITEFALAQLASAAEAGLLPPDYAFSPRWLRTLGMLPCPYLRYYYETQRMLEEEQKAAAEGGEGTRAQVVQAVEKTLFQKYQDPDLAEKPEELSKRGGAYYSEVAVNLMTAIETDRCDIHIVNVRNDGTISGLSDNIVVEVPSVVGRDGPKPIAVGQVEPKIRGLIQVVKAYEELTVQAGAFGDRAAALAALATHPLVPDERVAEKLLDEILAVNAEHLPQFR
ncbi:MAG TPA: 6-phospho-beta-glucosidase [Bacillota bacterium]